MSNFKSLSLRPIAKFEKPESEESLYWKNYEFPVTVKEFTSIDYIDVCKTKPNNVAVTSGPKVDIYCQSTAKVLQTFTRFQKVAFGATLRHDGELLLSGSQEAQVKLFSIKQKLLLRTFYGHKGAVHRSYFVHGNPQIVSFSDDKTAILWDMCGGKAVHAFDAHQDYIRAGSTSPSTEHIFVSGSYDHSIRVWDTRVSECVATLQHEDPVECLLFYPSGTVFASAGGSQVRIWDLVAGKLLSSISQHHKTVTCLSLASNNTRLLSGAIDKHIKVYDTSSYATMHNMQMPAPILSLGVTPGDACLVAGMLSKSSGLVSFQQRHAAHHISTAVNSQLQQNVQKTQIAAAENEQVIKKRRKEFMQRYDHKLRCYKFSSALDDALKSYYKKDNKQKEMVFLLLKELLRRDALKIALAGRDNTYLRKFVVFIKKNIKYSAYTAVLIQTVHCLLDVYEDHLGEKPFLIELLRELSEEVNSEVCRRKEFVGVLGLIQMMLSVSSGEKEEATIGGEQWTFEEGEVHTQQLQDGSTSIKKKKFTGEDVQLLEEILDISKQ